jgi:hypothetical protein
MLACSCCVVPTSGIRRGIGYDGEGWPVAAALQWDLDSLRPGRRRIERGAKIMIGAALSFLFVFGQVPSTGAPPDPSALVAQLGADRYSDREAAAEALARLGRLALPALRDNRLAADLEIRTRTQNLIRKIEGALLIEPTRVRLDFDDLPLNDVIQALNRQVGFRISLYPENLPRWKSERLTIHRSGLIEFWQAVDQLCDLADLQYNPILQGYAGHREPIFTFTAAAVRTATPNFDFGPFRVSLLGLHYQRDVSFAGGNMLTIEQRAGNGRPARRVPHEPAHPTPVLSVQFTAQLQVAGEPRLSVQQTASPHVVEAVDDRGNSLIPPANENPAFNRFSGYFGVVSGPVMQVQASLNRPVDAGTIIKKLRGVIPVTVSSRQPDPLVVSLPDSAGKTFGGDDLQITVHSIRGLPNNRQTAIELSVKAPDDRATATENSNPDGFNPMMPRLNVQQLPIEILDARGQLVPWFQSSYDAETAHVVLTLPVPLQGAPLKELRYYTLNRANTGIPFEFTNVPMP